MPSQAPVNLRAHNTSSTSLFVTWEPVPNDHVNGILLGFKLFYKKYGPNNASTQNATTTMNFTVLTGLEKFTIYEVKVLAFTRLGDGPEAAVAATTDEDGERKI